jgi:succinate dehydrogenase / fumarate reductase iron-sulfur subunit
MKLHLKIWRQKNRKVQGKLVNYTLENVNPHMSFLEMLDTLNEQLIQKRRACRV